ncbi:MAG: inorganic diphosphatase [Sulfolobales archaeon]
MRKLRDFGAGERVPNYVYVVIEISLNSDVEYVYDEDLDMFRVERVLDPEMRYPFNKGFIPGTLDVNEKPLGAIVLSSRSFIPGFLVEARPIGFIELSYEEGLEHVIISVPRERIDPLYANVRSLGELSEHIRSSIENFYEKYKRYNPEKSFKLNRWGEVGEAREIILESVKRALSSRNQKI